MQNNTQEEKDLEVEEKNIEYEFFEDKEITNSNSEIKKIVNEELNNELNNELHGIINEKDIEGMTIPELKNKLDMLKINYTSRLKKQQLQELLKENIN